MKHALLALLASLGVAGCGAGSSSPVVSRVAPAEPQAPEPALRSDVVITGGVHGNEPSGALALPELANLGFSTFGPCNPWGLKNGSRFLADGRDLNRSFARTDVPEVEAVKAFLAEHPPGLLLDLHEDGRASGAYLIQHGPGDPLGRRIVEALKGEIDFDPAPRFTVVTGDDGLLAPSRITLAAVGMSRFYGLAFYAWQTFGATTFVVEVPSRWSLDRRTHAHRRIAETARRLFSEPRR